MVPIFSPDSRLSKAPYISEEPFLVEIGFWWCLCPFLRLVSYIISTLG